jgi:hypothetical protein
MYREREREREREIIFKYFDQLTESLMILSLPNRYLEAGTFSMFRKNSMRLIL